MIKLNWINKKLSKTKKRWKDVMLILIANIPLTDTVADIVLMYW